MEIWRRYVISWWRRQINESDVSLQGNLRVDVNVSVHRAGMPFGTRCEIKNINSVRFLQAAIGKQIQLSRLLLTDKNSRVWASATYRPLLHKPIGTACPRDSGIQWTHIANVLFALQGRGYRLPLYAWSQSPSYYHRWCKFDYSLKRSAFGWHIVRDTLTHFAKTFRRCHGKVLNDSSRLMV